MKKLLFLLFPLFAHAAGPLMHLVVAENYMWTLPIVGESAKRAFFLGNVFPDIQYLGVVSRHETHETGLALKDIDGPNAFIVGMKLHSFVDEEREKIVVQNNMYSDLEELGGKYKASLLKFIEDEILHDYACAKHYIPLFNGVHPEEIAYGIPEEAHKKSHRHLQNYLSQRPSTALALLAKQNLPLFNIPAETVQLWSVELPKLARQEKYRNHVIGMMDHFVELFQQK